VEQSKKMVDPEVLPALDSPPKSGVWVEGHPGEDLTDEEVEAGERLGAAIDIDDDEDNGHFN